MIQGLTTAAAGMAVEERLQQLLANNLANEQTPGFKVSAGEFLETPVQNVYSMQYGGPLQNYIGQMGTGVVFQEGVPSFSAGTLSQTGRSLDVAIADSTPSGPLATVQGPGAGGANAANAQTTVAGVVAVGNGGRLGVNGQPLAVFDANGQAVTGLYAVRNPQYQGTALTGIAGSPDYDGAGHPSFLFANAQGQVVATPGENAAQSYGVRVGTASDMGNHSFYAVNYVSSQGQTGIALTKDGALQLDANNNLVDSAGNLILPIGANGQPIAGGRITINSNYSGQSLFGPGGQALTDAQGQPSYRVYGANGNVVAGARLGTVDADVTTLSPLGATEFQVGNSLTAATVLPQLQVGTGQLKPGELEQSNVDPTSTMTQMMNAVNLYEANQRMVQTEDTMLNVTTTDIGKVTG